MNTLEIARQLIDEQDPQACTQMEYEEEVKAVGLHLMIFGEAATRKMVAETYAKGERE